MRTIRFRDGSVLRAAEYPSSQALIFIHERGQRFSGRAFMPLLLQELRARRISYALYEDPERALDILYAAGGRFASAPLWKRRLGRALLLAAHPYSLRPLLRRMSGKKKWDATRATKGLRGALRALGNPARIVIIGRSAGARAATLAADESGVAGIIGMAYPFRDPTLPVEPARYLHLAAIRTPTVIFQGVRDSYGGKDVRARYVFSPSVEFAWVETDHDFQLDDAADKALAKRVLETALRLAGASAQAPRAPAANILYL